jgi:hypothetical protein
MSISSSLIRRTFILPIAFALTFSSLLPGARAQSAPQLDKHARKIERHLAKYRKGTYLNVDLRDDSQIYGSLGSLAETSFQFTDSDSNKVETYSYSDIASVRNAKEYIGSGSEPGRHLHVPLPMLIVSGVVAAGAAAYLAIR